MRPLARLTEALAQMSELADWMEPLAGLTEALARMKGLDDPLARRTERRPGLRDRAASTEALAQMNGCRMLADWMEPLAQLTEALARTKGQVLVVTGAGVSLASGIPTFRGKDPGAVWAKDVTELGTVRYFSQEPAGSWKWYLGRFEKVLAAQPNPAHHALVALEQWQLARGGKFLLVSQNIDPLHERAGSKQLVKVHGSAEKVRCSSQGCRLGAPDGWIPRTEIDLTAFLANPIDANVPRCPECGELLRQHVLWFDEYYNGHHDYQWPRVLEASASADLVIFAGTSHSVGVTQLVHEAALDRAVPVFSIDPAAQPLPGGVVVAAAAEVALVEVCRGLGIGHG